MIGLPRILADGAESLRGLATMLFAGIINSVWPVRDAVGWDTERVWALRRCPEMDERPRAAMHGGRLALNKATAGRAWRGRTFNQ